MNVSSVSNVNFGGSIYLNSAILLREGDNMMHIAGFKIDPNDVKAVNTLDISPNNLLSEMGLRIYDLAQYNNMVNSIRKRLEQFSIVTLFNNERYEVNMPKEEFETILSEAKASAVDIHV